jgi:hypothetical protein
VRLTVTEFLILHALANRPGFVKSRDSLMDAAYDDQVYVDDRTIDSHIKRIRKKFRDVDDTLTASRPCMASDTVTRRLRVARAPPCAAVLPAANRTFCHAWADHHPDQSGGAERLIGGMFAITENRRGLVDAKVDSLSAQAEIIANIITETAVYGDAPGPAWTAMAPARCCGACQGYMCPTKRARCCMRRARCASPTAI